MSVENTQIIDLIGIDNSSDECVLTISDHLEWSLENNHILLLQEKINTYLSFIESGEILDSYPQAKNKAIRIELVLKYHPKDFSFLNMMKSEILKIGYGFKVENLDQS